MATTALGRCNWGTVARVVMAGKARAGPMLLICPSWSETDACVFASPAGQAPWGLRAARAAAPGLPSPLPALDRGAQAVEVGACPQLRASATAAAPSCWASPTGPRSRLLLAACEDVACSGLVRALGHNPRLSAARGEKLWPGRLGHLRTECGGSLPDQPPCSWLCQRFGVRLF